MIARGQGRRVPPPFAPAGPPARRIAPTLVTAPEPGSRHRARGPPGKAPIKIDAMTSLGRPTIPPRTCCWASGRTPPAQRKTKLPILHQQTKETW
jgi:hypothetical protein